MTRKNGRTGVRLAATAAQAASGTRDRLGAIGVFANQYRGYEVRIDFPEYTSVCPKSGLPDFGAIAIEYVPDKFCLELKSLKNYFLGYRGLGIFNENAVNRILDDVVRACRPARAVVTGSFTARGGMRTTIVARHPRP